MLLSFLNFFHSLYLSFQVQTTLTVVEEERDRFMTKLLNEEKARKTLEGALVFYFFFEGLFQHDYLPDSH